MRCSIFDTLIMFVPFMVQVDDRFTEQLKDNVLAFAKALSKNFRGVSVNVEQEFGKGSLNLNNGDGAD